MRHGLQLQGSGKVDMYEAAGAGNKGKHSRERGRWGQHMSSHFSRSLAEGDIGEMMQLVPHIAVMQVHSNQCFLHGLEQRQAEHAAGGKCQPSASLAKDRLRLLLTS